MTDVMITVEMLDKRKNDEGGFYEVGQQYELPEGEAKLFIHNRWAKYISGGDAGNGNTGGNNNSDNTTAAPAMTFVAAETAARALTSNDFGKLLSYDSETNGQFTIPEDSTLGITDSIAYEIKIKQLNTGRVDIVAANANVTLNKSTDYPSSTQDVIQTLTRTAANTWTLN